MGPSGAVGDIVSGGFEVTATFATELVRVSEDEDKDVFGGLWVPLRWNPHKRLQKGVGQAWNEANSKDVIGGGVI